jgi:CubicO group peptidase (beta-lactamase class C family)
MATSDGLSKARLRRMKDVLAGHVESGSLPGLVALVSRRGEPHVETIGEMAVAGKPMRRNTLFRIASMTKPVTAAAAMILVEECRIRLDDPVDPWLPELADRKVLKSIDSPLDQTVPARRALTLRDLMTFTMGLGAFMAPPGTYPIQKAMEELKIAPGPEFSFHTPDEFMKRIGSLPLAFQPGETWLYHTGLDVLGVMIARVTGQTLGAFLKERLFEPLGMTDTGFHAPKSKIGRLATAYRLDPKTRKLAVFDEPQGGRFAGPPKFEAGGAGLVSTIDDFAAFLRMMLNNGKAGRTRILSRPSVELMTSDQLTAQQKAGADVFFKGAASWGFGMAVVTRRTNLFAPGRFGWDGGYGTTGHADPAEGLIGILMTQRLMDSPMPPPHFSDFWASAYQAIDD